MSFTSFQLESLKSHNTYRTAHGVPPLTLNASLCRFSQEWANNLAARGTMQHRPNSDYGENIYNMWSTDPNYTVKGGDAVDAWYSEIKDYKFGQEPKSLGTGHFTQVVWKESKELGVGIAKNKNGQTFVVANYSPPGNYVGFYTLNVFPPSGSKTVKK